MNQIKINDRVVGGNSPVYIIAEAGDNHMGSVVTAKEMARLAKISGADAVKFQHHIAEEEMLPDTPMSDNMLEPLYDFLKRNALTINDHILLSDYCKSIGIQYLCTPFSYAAAVELYENNLLDAIKIGSGEMTDIPSLLRMSKFKVPMIVSTGMCTLEEIEETYNALIQSGVQLALLNCVSEYPPVYEDINLGFIKEMESQFKKAVIGQSDHTPTNYTCFAAVALGAKLVEKHVIINKLTPGPDQSVSLDFNEFSDLVKGIRIIEAASGASKKVHNKEISIRNWAFRSLVSTREIKAGEIINESDVWSKRPGTGIPSKYMNQMIGKKALVDIAKNKLLSWDEVE
jgi:N,N'-diacetyllegionaminate synthase